MSSLQKLLTGSSSSRPCQSCGKGVYIPWKYNLSGIAVLAVLFIVPGFVRIEPLSMLIIGLGFAVVYSLLQVYLFPLARDKFDEIL